MVLLLPDYFVISCCSILPKTLQAMFKFILFVQLLTIPTLVTIY